MRAAVARATIVTVTMGGALLAGCASRSTAAAGATSEHVVTQSAGPRVESAEDRIRCALIADSVRSATPLANLPGARPRGRTAMPSPGAGATAGEVRTTFLVDPSGSVVPGSVVVSGPASAGFRQEMEIALRGALFQPPKVRGCPSWSRGDLRMRVRIERRRME